MRFIERARALEEELAIRGRLETELQDAIVARDEFISIASHELRNPLDAIHLQVFGALHAARAAAPGNAVSERLSRIADQVARLARLLDNLLDVSRLTAGRIDLELEPLNLSDVVQEVVDRNREQLAACTVMLDLPSVVGRWDRLRLDQIATNLVSNAIKYGEGQPISIFVDSDDASARLRVSDSGVGMSAVDIAKLFARFERAGSPSGVGGFGLGLWITKQLVEAMRGSIAVESAPNRGSTFTVSLPLVEVSRSVADC